MEKRNRQGLGIRWMTSLDVPAGLGIDSAHFGDPWEAKDFRRIRLETNIYGKVSEHDGRVVAFMFYELHKTRLELLNFTVGRDDRDRGFGEAMVAKLISHLSFHGRSRIVLQVRETKLSAQKFFRSCGFRAVEVLRRVYEDTDEDAYTMEFRVTDEKRAVCDMTDPQNRIRDLGN